MDELVEAVLKLLPPDYNIWPTITAFVNSSGFNDQQLDIFIGKVCRKHFKIDDWLALTSYKLETKPKEVKSYKILSHFRGARSTVNIYVNDSVNLLEASAAAKEFVTDRWPEAKIVGNYHDESHKYYVFMTNLEGNADYLLEDQ